MKTNMDKLRIPAIMLHDVKNGHIIELWSGFVPETVHVYKVNSDRRIREEFKYNLSKSKDKFSLSSTTLYLPTCLKKDDRVCIQYDREIKGIKIKIGNSCVNSFIG